MLDIIELLGNSYKNMRIKKSKFVLYLLYSLEIY